MDKKKRNAPGTVHIEDVKLEGGITIPIILHKEAGIFRASHLTVHEGDNITHSEHEAWEDKDLDKVRAKIRDWHKDKIKLGWEPVIVLRPGKAESYGGSAQNVLGSSFERLMRAKKLTSDAYEWRTWAYRKPGNDGFVYAHDLEVYEPGAKSHEPEPWRDEKKPAIIVYTPERWQALLQLVKMEEALKDRLEEMFQVDEKKLDFFFRTITRTGFLAFSGLKVKEKPDA